VDPRYEVAIEQDGMVVVMRGELDRDSAATLSSYLSEVIDAGVTMPVIDLSECTFVDSAGLKVFIETAARLAEQDGGRLSLVNPQPQAREVFERIDGALDARIFQHRSAVPWLTEATQGRRPDSADRG
jgi:anti-anti-sigma factor